MSVLVMSMEIPKKAMFAAILPPDDEHGTWYIRVVEGKGKTADYELTPLPEKHGRLIDADDMERFMSDTVQGDIRQYPYSDALWDMAFQWIDSRPTIIERED